MRVLIVEDEPIVARRLARIVAQALPEVSVTAAGSTEEAARALREQAFELLLLDLNLSGDDGFALLAQSSAQPAAVVVVSAHPERAVEAFEHEIVDFVPKPFSEERLGAALDRALAKLRNLPGRTLAVRVRKGWRFVRLTDIEHVRAADDYCELVLSSGERLLHAVTLERLSKLLPPSFKRVHRGAIVNLQRLDRLRRRGSGGYEAVTAAGDAVPVGRSYLEDLRAVYEGEGRGSSERA
jgi:two-component system, LytTR family, response regulator LytT